MALNGCYEKIGTHAMKTPFVIHQWSGGDSGKVGGSIRHVKERRTWNDAYCERKIRRKYELLGWGGRWNEDPRNEAGRGKDLKRFDLHLSDLGLDANPKERSPFQQVYLKDRARDRARAEKRARDSAAGLVGEEG